MKFNIQTFGCKVNIYESQWLRDEFERNSFEWCDDISKCDICVINSCTVTQSGDSRAVSALKKIRKKAPQAISVLTGCFPQTKQNNLENIDADIITGTKNRKSTVDLIMRYLNKREKIIEISKYLPGDSFENMEVASYEGHTRAFVKIQDGCNQFCSFCAIPFARGRCRSKPPEIIRDEMLKIAADGYKEVVLCGINLAFWGMEWNMHLRDAVEIAHNAGICRIRLGSLEPERITMRDIEYFASCPGFCPQFHLSLQSGCDKTLKAMNRRYTSDEYLKLCENIRKAMPLAAITTDVMVGFPGETDEDFETSLEFLKKCELASVHIFRYSKRQGTRAAAMPNQVSEDIKIKRHKIMENEVANLRTAFNKKMEGETLPVLFEKRKEEDFLYGHAPNGVIVKILSENSKKDLRNRMFYVKIYSSDSNSCYGKIINEII